MRCILTVIALIAVSPVASAADRVSNERADGGRSPVAAATGPTTRSHTSCTLPGAGELRIEVDGLRSSRGVLLIGLYDSAESFDRAIELAGDAGFLNDPNRVAGA